MTAEQQANDIMLASAVLYDKGVLDAFGHVSCRNAADPNSFLMSYSKAPGRIRAEDVLVHNLEGDILTKTDKRPFLERFIHSEIYKLRPDVNAIIHSHAPSVVPFTVVEGSLRPVCHMCGFLQGSEQPYEIRNSVGDASDMLIRNAQLGKDLAEHLSDLSVVLMRGHGFTVATDTLAKAVFMAVYTEVGARIQLSSIQLGEPNYLTSQEAKNSNDTNIGQMDRAWKLWVEEINLKRDF